MKFRPLHDRVVVRRVEEDTKTKGGIIIPDTAQEKPMQGEVIAVGVVSGVRPCTGSILVLLFALANGVFLLGIAAAFSIAFGVAIGALGAVLGKGVARS